VKTLIPLLALAGVAAAQTLDFQVYRTKVEPIFMKKRPSHARCIVCHQNAGGRLFRLEPFSPGATTWNEEQSRKNFETVSKLAKPGDPLASLICRQPLAPEAGGNDFHSGGRQFTSQTDPDWKAIADWIRGAK
jgi:hypothetical protein